MRKNKHDKSSNKSFGFVFFIIFTIIAFYPVVNGKSPQFYFFPIAILFLILGLLNAKILTPLNIAWINFGLFLGRIFSPIIMGFIYFLIVTPIGIIMRLLNKDLLKLRYNKKSNTYWLVKKDTNSKMKYQF
tara:strand:+ start:216 stop:608 length:393 start_codon:yes stop_codon:yes gene_type:complete